MESAFPRWKLAKRSHLHLLPNGWRISRGTQPERRMLCLESYCYNKSDSGPKSTASLRLDSRKSFLVCSDPCSTFLSSACISFTPNQVLIGSRLPLTRIVVSLQVPSYNHSTLLVLLYWLSQSCTLLSVIHFRARSL
jgi:hypothetical protein